MWRAAPVAIADAARSVQCSTGRYATRWSAHELLAVQRWFLI